MTAKLAIGSAAKDVQTALNDLPNLSPNLVNVSQSIANDGVSVIYNVTFSADLGDVDLIREVSGNVNATIAEVIAGSATGARIQLKIENGTTDFFKLNDTSSNVSFNLL